jgi:hypothetical protein
MPPMQLETKRDSLECVTILVSVASIWLLLLASLTTKHPWIAIMAILN